MEGPVDSDFGTRIHFHADSKDYIVRLSRWRDWGPTLNLMPRRHNVCVCVNFAACPVVVVWIVQCCCGTKGVCSEDA